MHDERDLPEGVIDADPAGGWDENDDIETRERNRSADDSWERGEAWEPGEARQGVDPVESDAGTRGVDPDLAIPDEEVE